MWRLALAAGAAVIGLAGVTQAMERVGQKEFDSFARCFAQQVGISQMLYQHADDWTVVFGENADAARDQIAVVFELAEDISALSFYMADLLSELAHPAYGLDADQAEAVYIAEMAVFDAQMALDRDARMAIVEGEDFVLEMSDLCAAVGDAIELAVLTNIESGAVVWDE